MGHLQWESMTFTCSKQIDQGAENRIWHQLKNMPLQVIYINEPGEFLISPQKWQ